MVYFPKSWQLYAYIVIVFMHTNCFKILEKKVTDFNILLAFAAA